MTFLKYYWWLIPALIFGFLAIVTPLSPWLLGLSALVIIVLGWVVGWLVLRTRESAPR
jgi:hypothetical protein